jgi:hypothetical protein
MKIPKEEFNEEEKREEEEWEETERDDSFQLLEDRDREN